MLTVQLKLRLRPAQERRLDRWLFHLSGVYNWAIRKIELDAKDGIYRTRYEFGALLRGHSRRVGIPADVLTGVADQAYLAWARCFRGISRRPRFKGRRNRLNSISFSHHPGTVTARDVNVPGIGRTRYHKQDVPVGHIGSARLVKRASGWYFVLFVQTHPNPVPVVADGAVGIDGGFSRLLTTSEAEVIEHPRELEAGEHRLAQAQRGHRKALTGRLQERIANVRKDRNHKLSRRLVSENALIAWSKDNHAAIARRFGKSVTSSSHGQLRMMLAYKSRSGGRQFVEVPSRNSTRTCSTCAALTGPTGWAGLKIRSWKCVACGAAHDRDVNAAVNTLKIGRGLRLESHREMTLGIAI